MLTILGGFGYAFRAHFWSLGNTLEPHDIHIVALMVPSLYNRVLITFLDDFGSDSGRPGTAKACVLHCRGQKKQVFMEVDFGSFWERLLETF